MTRILRHARRATTDLLTYSVRTGRWWFPLLIVALGGTVIAVIAIKTAAPTAVYVFF